MTGLGGVWDAVAARRWARTVGDGFTIHTVVKVARVADECGLGGVRTRVVEKQSSPKRLGPRERPLEKRV